MGSWLERFYGCCTSADWCWWPNSRKYNPAATASGCEDDADDALIELGGTANNQTRLFESTNGIAMLSRGQIKYVKAGVTSGSAHMGIPIIDPLIGQDYNVTTNRHHHQRQLFTQLHQHARLLVNKNIFHWHHQQSHHHQWWWDSSTPPSSVDLEWEHEGLMPPVTESASEDGGADHEEEEEDYDTADDDDRNQETDQERLADIDDAVVGTSGTNVTNASRNDSVVHRSPSPSSACHSLEWDSNGDDFFATTVDHCRAGQVKPTVRPSAYQTPLDI